MRLLPLILLLLASPSEEPPWSELSLTIEPETGYSSDQVAICRVRVINHGSRTWPGRTLHFEARALDGGAVVERARGRFGLSLPPHGTLETLISFSAPYRRFEVSPAASSEKSGRRGAGGKTGGKKGGKKPRTSRHRTR
jgi:hypothetical protein